LKWRSFAAGALAVVVVPVASVTPARAEPVSLILIGKALFAKIGAWKAASMTPVLMPMASTAKVSALSATTKAMIATQATKMSASASTISLTGSKVSVGLVSTGSASVHTVTISRAVIRTALVGAGLAATSGFAKADDEVAQEIALATATRDTSVRLQVCKKPDGTAYPVPSAWQQCPMSGEQLMFLDGPLNVR
jgi:hypothetical protein